MRDWQQLRELFHPQARIGVSMARGMPIDPEDAIAALQAAHEDTSYYADVESTRVLDEHAVLLSGHVRYRATDGRLVQAERGLLYVVVDNLLYRSRVFETEREALETYARLGTDLGVPSSS